MISSTPHGGGDVVNEHSFILNHSPHDGKLFTRGKVTTGHDPAEPMRGLNSGTDFDSTWGLEAVAP